MPKPIVWILGTGGTIASRYDPKLGGHVAAASTEDLINAVPELREVADIRALEHAKINSPSLDTATVFGYQSLRAGQHLCHLVALVALAQDGFQRPPGSRVMPVAP